MPFLLPDERNQILFWRRNHKGPDREKGNFHSGYCIVEENSIVVVNKFFDTEARINCLLEILDTMQYDAASMSVTNLKTLNKVQSVLTSQDISG